MLQSISRGDFYELHYKVDPQFTYAKLPDYKRTGGWHGDNLGLERYQGLDRIWYGAPVPLKVAVGGGSVGATGLAYAYSDGENPR